MVTISSLLSVVFLRHVRALDSPVYLRKSAELEIWIGAKNSQTISIPDRDDQETITSIGNVRNECHEFEFTACIRLNERI